ncbi:MAG: thioredoxin domain-containing protein [Anaerolineae bacterium]|nr:thioredoxin domain-containing protein [Anaerolineae bacterium]
MPNRLQHENSPYLLQHQYNPVDWYPWGAEALEQAAREDKPIFLSIGYAACHWCHVMAHESFENPTTAALMNQNFINIKVDREERPDLDHIYMQAVQAMTGSGGWPMSVFLTPQGKPFWGGTYFPPSPRPGMPSFNQVIAAIAEAWRSDRQGILSSGENFTQKLYNEITAADPQALSPQALRQAAAKLADGYDRQEGGWGTAPKFPLPVRLLFLLQQAAGSDQDSLKLAEHALQSMAQGGMYDVVGGGFARYSTDARWLVPHFEKMLYDNALLARAYLYAYLLTGNPEYRHICEETLRFIQREMTLPDGGFLSAIDADSEGEEGKFYLWRDDEIDRVLPDPEDNLLLRTVYHVPVQGNFEGRIILQRMRPLAEAAERLGLTLDKLQQRLDQVHGILYRERETRIHPHRDDKVLTAWNAMMIQTLAEAGRYLNDASWLAAAQNAAEFLLANLYPQDHLLRSWRKGKARVDGFLEDHAALILALLELYQSDANPRWYAAARSLTETMLREFHQPGQGFFDTPRGAQTLITRPQDLQDNATPSGSAQAVLALLRMAALEGSTSWHDLAVETLQRQAAMLVRYPAVFSHWLSAYALALAEPREIAIIGDPTEADTRHLWETAWSAYRPFQVCAVSSDPPAADAPPLVQDRDRVNGQATVYVCRHHACQAPVTTAQALQALLAD